MPARPGSYTWRAVSVRKRLPPWQRLATACRSSPTSGAAPAPCAQSDGSRRGRSKVAPTLAATRPRRAGSSDSRRHLGSEYARAGQEIAVTEQAQLSVADVPDEMFLQLAHNCSELALRELPLLADLCQ